MTDLSSLPSQNAATNTREDRIRVLSPKTGKVGFIPSNYLQTAMSQGYKQINESLENSITTGEGYTKVLSPVTGKEGMMPNASLAQALLQGYEPVTSANVLEYGQEVLRGGLSRAGQVLDTAIAGGAALFGAAMQTADPNMGEMNRYDVGQPAPSTGNNQEIADQAFKVANDFWQNKKTQGYVEDKLDTGLSHLSSVRAANTGGQFASDVLTMNVVGEAFAVISPVLKAVKMPFVDKMGKLLTTEITPTNIASFFGAGVGLELIRGDGDAPAPADETKLETVGRVSLNLLRDTTGMILGSIAPNAAIPAGKATIGSLNAMWQKGKENVGTLGRKLLGATELNQEVVQLAKEAGINTKDLKAVAQFAESNSMEMYNVKANSELLQYLTKKDLPIAPELLSDGTAIKLLAEARFTEDIAQAMVKKGSKALEEDMLKVLDDKFGQIVLGTESVTTSNVVSEEAKSVLAAKQKEWLATAGKMYDASYGFVGEGTVAFNENTKTFQALEEVRKNILGPNHQGQILDPAKESLIQSFESIKTELSQQNNYRAVIDKMRALRQNAFEGSGVEKLNKRVADAIYDDISDLITSKGEVGWAKYKTATPQKVADGVGGFRSGSVQELEAKAFMGEIPSDEFLKQLDSANNFYKEYIFNRLYSKQAQDILRGDGNVAIEAYSLLNTAKNVAKIKDIFKDTPEVLNKMLGIKTQEILTQLKVFDEGTLNLQKFVEIFGKGPGRQIITENKLSHIVGQDTINQIRRNLFPIANQLAEYQLKAGTKNAANDSMKGLLKYASGVTGGITGATFVGGGAATGAGALVGLGVNKYLSSILNDPKAVRKLITESKAAKQPSQATIDFFKKKYSKLIMEGAEKVGKPLIAPTVEGYANAVNTLDDNETVNGIAEDIRRIINQYPWLKAWFDMHGGLK